LQLMVMDLSADYVLAHDIDLGELANACGMWTTLRGFVPVGNGSTAFTGTFDGNGHAISGLVINRPTTTFVGLFGRTYGATISNVGMQGGSVSGFEYVGGLVGYNNRSTITNAYATGTVAASRHYVGGLVGFNCNYSTITNAYATGSVSGNDYVGGLVGYNYNQSTITNAYATGSVSGNCHVGGLVGANNYSTITNAYATGSVSGYDCVGGLVGYNYNYSTITNAYATGNVSSSGGYGRYVGGLIGLNDHSTVSDCHATGSVVGDQDVGGLVGGNLFSSVVTRSHATGSVTARGLTVGGLVGWNYEHSSIIDSYATGEVRGHTSGAAFPYAGGLVGANDWYSAITGSYATGNVIGNAGGNGTEEVGGLVGLNRQNSSISSSYATGNVTGASGTSQSLRIGGLVGWNCQYSTITNAYASGSVSGTLEVGGLVGSNSEDSVTANAYATGSVSGSQWLGGLVGWNNGTIQNCFWDMQTSGMTQGVGYVGSPNSYGVTGLPTAEMKQHATFLAAGWDFTNVWHMIEGQTYPLLQYQPLPGVALGGIVYLDAGTTAAGAGLNVSLAVDGVIIGTTQTIAGGAYSFLINPALLDHTGMVVYLDGGAALGATGLHPAGGSITNLDIYTGTLTAWSGDPMSNALFAQAGTSVLDANIPYITTTVGSTVNLTLLSGVSFLLPAGNAYTLDGNITTDGGGISMLGATTLLTSATLTTLSDHPVNLGGTLSWSATHDLTVNSGGGIWIAGSLETAGGNLELSASTSIAIHAGSQVLSTSGNISIRAPLGVIDLTGSVQAAGGNVTVTGATVNLANLMSVGGTLSGASSTVNVANSASIQQGVDITGSGGAVNIDAGAYAESVLIDDVLILRSVGGVVTARSWDSSATSISLNGSFAASAGGMALGPIVLLGHTRLETPGSTAAEGIAVGAVTGNGHNLTLDAGTSGVISVASINPVDVLTIVDSGQTTFTGPVEANTVDIQATTGTVAFQGNLTVHTALLTTAHGYAVSITGDTNTVTGATTFLNTGTVTLGKDGAATQFAAGLDTANGPSLAYLGGLVEASAGDIVFGHVELLADTGVLASGGNIRFQNTVDGGYQLGAEGGEIRFLGVVGGDTALDSLGARGTHVELGQDVTVTNLAGFDTSVSLVQTGGGLTAPELLLLGSGLYTLDRPSNHIGTMAADVLGNVRVTNSQSLAVDTVHGTTGVTTGDGNLCLTLLAGDLQVNQAIDAGAGTVRLNLAGGVSQTTAGTITAEALGVVARGAVDLREANDVNTLAVRNELAGASVAFNDVDGFDVTTVTAGVCFTSDVVGVSALAGGSIRLTADADIRVTSLVESGTGPIDLVAGGNVTIDGGVVSGGAERIRIEATDGVLGTTTTGYVENATGNIRLIATHNTGTAIDLQGYVRSGGGNLLVKANEGAIATGGAGYLDAGSGRVTLQAQTGVTAGARITADRLLLLGTGSGDFVAANSGNSVNTLAADVQGNVRVTNSQSLTVDTVHGTKGVTTGDGNLCLTLLAGDLQVNQAIDAGAGTVRLNLAGGVSQTTAGTIAAEALGVVARGAVDLREANDVNRLAVRNRLVFAPVLFNDVDGFDVASVSAGGCFAADVVGVRTLTGGPITLNADSGRIRVLDRVVSGGSGKVLVHARDGAVVVASGGEVTSDWGTITLNAARGMRIAGLVQTGSGSANAVRLNAGQDIRISGGGIVRTIGGDITMLAGADINVAGAVESWTGAVSFDATTDLHVRSGGLVETFSGPILLGAGSNVEVRSGLIQSYLGEIDLVAGGDIRLIASAGDSRLQTAWGDINVLAAGNLRLTGSASGDAMLGSVFGDVDVTAGENVELTSGLGFAQIGHDGAAMFNNVFTAASSHVSVHAGGNISLTADQAGGYAQIGHAGNGLLELLGGDVDVEAYGQVRLRALACDSTAQIGHGGNACVGAAAGAINVTAGTGPYDNGIELYSGGENSTAQIGHGGRGYVGLMSGDITVITDASLRMGGTTDGVTLIGHGGQGSTSAT
ncbi:MAG: GLUG motif-containing protein, partial [Patescibacteria group bacterium]|nr:GLUG motif-containing protein [Patescibacteria group bacterium]